jgi:TP901 family phage tail tape measure protein
LSDVNANIGINFNTADALAQLRTLQAGLSKFHQTLAQGNLAATNAQKGLNAQLIQSVNATGKFAASQAKVATSTQSFTSALEKNKLSMGQYFRYTAAAATANTKSLTNMFAQEREIINRARRDRVKALQAQYVQLQKANGGFADAIRIMPKTLMMANGQFTELGTRIQYAAQRQQFLNQLLKQGSTQLLNFGKNTQWAGRQLMVGLTIPLGMLASYAARAFKEMEAATVKFQRVYGDAFTDNETTDIAVENIKKIANEYTKFGINVTDTMEMAATAAAAGFQGAALNAQVREASKLAVLGQVEQQQALETTISLQNAFGLSTEDLAKKIDFLNAVENQTVLSIEDLTIAIPKAAPVVRQLGGDVEDLAFFMTAMKEGGINASEGANALKSGLASMINPTKKTSEMLAAMGINIKGIVEGNAGDLKGTVVGMARALDELDPLNRARAIEQLFGKFQFSRISTLFQNVVKEGSQASRALQLSGASLEELAIISEREMGKIEDSVGVKFQAAVEQFKQTIMPIGKQFLQALTPVVEFIGKLFEKFNNLSDGTKKFVTILTAVVAGIGPIFLMTFGLLANGLANLIKLFALIRGGMAKLNGQNKVLGGGFDYLTQQEIENLSSSNALHGAHSKLIQVFNVESIALQKLANSYANAGSQARALAASSPGLFASPGAAAAVSKLPGGQGRPVKRYAKGVLQVPGPKGAGDVQAAFLAPGEAVIPADVTAKNIDFLHAMMAGKTPGYMAGSIPELSPVAKSQSQVEMQKFFDWADDQIKSSNLAPQLKGRWKKSAGPAFRQSLMEKMIYDPSSKTFWTNMGGTNGVNLERMQERFNYRFGIAPDPQTGKYARSNLFNISKFLNNVTSGGQSKRAGDIAANNPKAKKVWDEIKVAASNPAGIKSDKTIRKYTDFLANMKDGSGNDTQLAKDLKSNSPLTRKTAMESVDKMFKLDASHAQAVKVYDSLEDAQSGKSRPASKNEKYSLGQIGPDYRVVNEFVKTNDPGNKSRFEKILEWNNKSGNPLAIDATQNKNLQSAIQSIIKQGNHPFDPQNQKHVKALAELEIKARDLITVNPSKAKGLSFLSKSPSAYINARLTDNIMSDRISDSNWFKKMNENKMFMNTSVLDNQGRPVRGGLETVRKSEYYFDSKTGRFIPYTGQNTSAVATGRVTGKGTETRTPDTNKTGGQPTATRSQATAFAARRDLGDPRFQGLGTESPLSKNAQGRITNAMQEQARLLKLRNNLSAREIEQALSQYRRRLVVAETEKANALIQKQTMREQAKIDSERVVNSRAIAKQERAQRRMARQEKVGRYSGGTSAALGGVAMGAMMMGADSKVTGGLFGASALAGMAPMLTNPYIAAGTAVVALVGSFWMLDKSAKKAAEAQSKLVDSTSGTSERMKSIGELTGKVGASEIYARRRSTSVSDRYTTGFERGKQQFGSTFLESETGKGVMSGFTESMKSGTDIAAKQMALQLSAYVSDGIMTAEQAHSVAKQIGINLNNQTLTSQISGQLLDLIGPSGEDLLKNPLEIRVRLVEEQRGLSKQIGSMFKKEMANPTDEFTDFTANDNAKKMAGQVAAYGAQNLEFNQAQIDSLNVQYDKELKILETQKAATTDAAKRKLIDDQIVALENKREVSVQTLRKANSEILKDQIAAFRIAQEKSNVENAFFDSLKDQVRTKYKGTAQEAFVDPLLKSTADLKSKELEVKINTIVASGQMPPATATTLLDMFSGDEAELNKFINITAKLQDPGKVSELVNSLGGIKNKKVVKAILTKISSTNPKEADKLMSTIALMQKMAGKEINIEAFFEQKDAMAQLQALQTKLEEVEGMPNPITKEAIALINTDGNSSTQDMTALLAVWDKWGNLPDETKKTVIQEYITLYKTIDDESALASIKARNPRARKITQAQINAEKGRIAAEETMQATKQDIESAKVGKSQDTPSDGSKKTDPLAFLDSLAMRIKNVRNAAFDATAPLKSMIAAFSGKQAQKDASKMFSLFDGLQQKMVKLGVPKEFRDMISGMNADDFNKFASLPKGKNMFTYENNKPKTKANITGLTKEGQAVMQTYREAVIGEFNVAQKEVLETTKNQDEAFKILIASGMSTSDALKTVEDSAVAAGIASGALGKNGSEEMKKFIADIQAASDETSRLNALTKARQSNSDFAISKNAPGLAKSMKEAGYSADQINEALSDPDIAKELIKDLKDGKIEAGDIKDYIDSIAEKKSIDIRVKLAMGDFAGAAEEGRQLVNEMFSVQEALITTGPLGQQLDANNQKIADYQTELLPFQKQIDGINQSISDAQRNIEIAYTRPIGALQTEIESLDRQLDTSPIFGNRAIKTIQDENIIYGNDLAVISHQADAVNKSYDEQVKNLNEVKAINDQIIAQQGRQLGLADALTQGDIAAAAKAAQEMRQANADQYATSQIDVIEQARQNALGNLKGPQSGLTQIQIQEKQYQNAQKLYAMENDPARLKIIADIQKKQDEIYNLQQLQNVELAKIKTKEDEIYNIENTKIRPIQTNIDALTYQNTVLQTQIDKQVSSLKVMGQTRGEWDLTFAKIDASALASKNLDTAFGGLLASAAAIDKMWTSILSKIQAYAAGVPASVTAQQQSITAPVTKTDTPPQAGTAATGAAGSAKTTGTPFGQASSSVTVKSGNTLSGIAATAGVKLADVIKANPQISNPNLIRPGQVIKIPSSALYRAKGGIVPNYFTAGGFARGTDTVPAMLTPGEFVMSKYAVDSYGVDRMKAINSGSDKSSSVYNYELVVNVKSDANASDIANTVMAKIKQVDNMRLKGNRF